MNLGSKIVKIRKDNKMSQETFAELFNVTRQTVSSWENSKSYPDIETLVKISDKFNISLDILLKDDKKMIKEIDKKIQNSNRYKKILMIILGIVIILALSFGIYSIKYNITKQKLENNFKIALEENDFYKNNKSYYSFNYTEDIEFSVPNQTMPNLLEFKLDFRAKHLYCDINIDDYNLKITWNDLDSYSIENYKNISNDQTESNYSFILYEKQDLNKLTEELGFDKELLQEIIDKGNNLYKDFYK